MRPLHWLALLAAVLVGAFLFYVLEAGGDTARRDSRTAADFEHAASSADRAGAPDARDGKEPSDRFAARLTVQLSDGSPAAGARIDLRGRAEHTVAADGRGRVAIEGLDPGRYVLLARHGAATGALDFVIERSDRDLGALLLRAAVVISGRVFGPGGEPVPAAEVEAVVSDPRSRGLDLTALVKTMTTPESVAAHAACSADGSYELLVPARSPLSLRAFAPGLAQDARAAREFTESTEGVDFHLLPGAALAGRVVNETGKPIAGARVMLVNPAATFVSGLPKAGVTTDAQGRFEIATTPSPQLTLMAHAPGYALYTQSKLALPARNLTIELERGVAVRLRAVEQGSGVPARGVTGAVTFRGGFGMGRTDEEGVLFIAHLPRKVSLGFGGRDQAILWGGGFVARTVDFGDREAEEGLLDAGEVEMDRGGVVRGHVLDSVSGEPIEDAIVRSLGGLRNELAFFGAATGRSGAGGRYELRGVAPGATGLLALHPDYSFDEGQAMVAFSGGGGGSPLFADGKLEAKRDIRLTPAATVEGRVLDPEGEPVPGARVQLAESKATLIRLLGGGTETALSDAEGRFRVRGLQRGKPALLKARHRGYSDSEPVRVIPDEAGPVTLSLREPLRVRGRVVDERGEPVSGVRVTADTDTGSGSGGMRAGPELDGGGASMTISGEAGEFLLANAPPGEVTVRFDHAEFATTSRRLRLSAGDAVHDLGEIRLPRGARIRGIVVDEDGEPLPGVTVFASADGAGPIPRQPADGEGGRNWGQASTGEDGRFVIHGLRSGRFRLQIWSAGRISDQPTVGTDGPETRIVSQRAAELTAYVRSRGVPVPNASVSAMLVTTRPDGSEHSKYVDSARTDGTGLFRLARLPPDRPVRLTIRHDGYRNGEFDQVSAADKGRVFQLEPGRRVEGLVVDGEGTPIARCRIDVAVDGSYSTSVTSNADGTFLVGGLESGKIGLTVTESGQNLIQGEPVVVTSGARSVRLVAERGLSIEGRILDRDGRPVGGVWPQAFDEEGNTSFGSATISEEGVFAIRGLRAGTYTLRVLRPREGGEPAVVAVREGVEAGVSDVTIEVAP